jgi:hypothetical protein
MNKDSAERSIERVFALDTRSTMIETRKGVATHHIAEEAGISTQKLPKAAQCSPKLSHAR